MATKIQKQTVPDGGSPTNMGPKDRARVAAFHFFYNRVLINEMDASLRFSKAIVYSARRLMQAQERRMLSWFDRNNGWAKARKRKAANGI